MNLPLGQYIKGKSAIHRLDPRTKLLGLVSLAVLIISKSHLWNHLLAFVLLVLLTKAARISLKRVVKLIWGFKYFILITFVINLLFTPSKDGLSFLFLHLSIRGAVYGILFSARMVLLLWAASLFSWVTSPVSLADSFEELFSFLKVFGVHPRDISTVILLSMRYIPTIIDDAVKIRWAQLARGAKVSGGIIKRVRQLVPLIIPVFATSFRRADKLAIALELRCYDPLMPRTRLTPLRLTITDKITILTMLALLVVMLVII